MFDSTISGKALASLKRQSKGVQSTLIAFPRVGRSISWGDSQTADNNDKQLKRSQPSNSYAQRNQHYFGEKRNIHTRSSKASMIAFPRVGKRNMPESSANNILKDQDLEPFQHEWDLSGNEGIFINVGCVGDYLNIQSN